MSSRIIVAALILSLIVYGLAIYVVTNALFDSYRGLDLSSHAAIWFGLNIYCFAIPFVGIILAYTFHPMFARPSEAVVSMPLSTSDWYSPQLKRFSIGLGAILCITWAVVSFVLGNIFELSSRDICVLIATAILLNAVIIGPLLIIVSTALFNDRNRLRYFAPAGYSCVLASWILYIRTHQDTAVYQASKYINEHQGITLIAFFLIAAAVIGYCLAFIGRQRKRYGQEPMKLADNTQRTSLILRAMPMPQSLSLKLGMATMRGIVLDRKNIGIIASSYVLFAGFAVAARLMHIPSVNSLILSAAALYFPLFMALAFVFARSMLGMNLHTIYVKPIASTAVVLGQQVSIIIASTLATIAILISLILIAGSQIIGSELGNIAIDAGCITAIAYMSGSLLRVSSRDQLGIIASIICIFVLQGAYQYFINRAAFDPIITLLLKIEFLALLIVVSILIEKIMHTKISAHHV